MRWLKATGPLGTDIGEAVRAFVSAPDWVAAMHLVQARQRELLSPAADEAIGYALDRVARGDLETREALEESRAVLERCRRDGIPATFGDILSDLAHYYFRKSDGDLAGNLGQAIRYYALALETYDRTSSPAEWATAAGDLGAAYLQRADSEQGDGLSETLERAIEYLDAALGEPSVAEDPVKRAGYGFNLGRAYDERVAGDRAANLENALAAYAVALTSKGKDDPPAEWALLYFGIGKACQQRVYGDRSSNIEAAIHHYTQALEALDQKDQPFGWAQVHFFLGGAYEDRIEGGPAMNQQDVDLGPRGGNLETAMEHYQCALTVLTRERHPELWAAAQGNLGNIYRQRGLGDPAENMDQSIVHSRLALQGMTAANVPSSWATVQSNLGMAYAQRGDLRQAVACHEQALSVADRLPSGTLLTTLKRLGDLDFAQGDWPGALGAYQRAAEADRAVLAGLQDRSKRREAAKYSARMYADTAYCLLRLQRPGEALIPLQQGKARLLAEILASEDADPVLPPEAGRAEHPGVMSTVLSPGEVLALIPEGGAMVALVFTSHGGMALVLPHGATAVEQRHVVDLKDFTKHDLFDLMFGYEEGEGGWLEASRVAQLAQIASGASRRAGGTFVIDWTGRIREMTGRLWAPLVEPIYRKLQDLGVPSGAEVVVLTDDGSPLPLHAASRQDGGQLRVFLDDYAVSYAPSAYLLVVAARRRRRLELDGAAAELCAVIDPTASLRFASVEADGLAAVFPSQCRRTLAGREATREAVLRELPHARYAHITSHGVYDWSDPEASTVALADGELSAADVNSSLRLHAARLVVLSACETGLTDVNGVPDEPAGLSAAFFRAGAAGVLGSAWAVTDISTALLLGRFYQHHIVDGLSPAAALRAAQYWIRTSTAEQLGLAGHWKRVYEQSAGQDVDAFQKFRYYQAEPGERPFDDPFFWAGYSIMGA
jgi:CHAT domain-containing protein/tetratricopeptide (TPR) repeat protein